MRRSSEWNVRSNSSHKRAPASDAGSTKQLIVAALDESLPRHCRFLGSHPLAGSEKAGATYASADLFEGRMAILTPTKNTRAEDFDLLEQFWQSLGSVVIQMTPEEHDEALALTSAKAGGAHQIDLTQICLIKMMQPDP